MLRASRLCVAITCALGLATGSRGQAQPGAITIGRTDSIYSATLKEWRRYQIYTPPGYEQSPFLPRAYPVLYLLDGNAHFHSVTGLIQFFSTGINATFVLPEMIVISIPNTNRTRDLTPTRSGASPDGKAQPAFAESGGGDNFLRFMRSELIPHIDSTFRVEPFRILVGHSFGGITAIHALYTMPEVFNAYVAIDPSFWWDHRVLIKRAAQALDQSQVKGRTLFVGHANTVDLSATDAAGPCMALEPSKACADTASTEHFRSIAEFNRLMKAGAARSLRYDYRYYPNDDHGSVPLIAEYDALRFIFDGYRLDVGKKPTPAAVRAQFSSLSKRLGYAVQPSERLMNALGSFIEIDTTWALSMARLYAEIYPKSPRANAVLGDALLATRDTGGASAAYTRSLAIDSTNQRIKTLLAKLKR